MFCPLIESDRMLINIYAWITEIFDNTSLTQRSKTEQKIHRLTLFAVTFVSCVSHDRTWQVTLLWHNIMASKGICYSVFDVSINPMKNIVSYVGKMMNNNNKTIRIATSLQNNMSTGLSSTHTHDIFFPTL